MPYTPQTWENNTSTPLSAARLNYMEAGIASAGGGGGGTIVVYASDALEPLGDYQCDGTADQVEINAAIQACSATGGTVVLSEGTFNLAAAVELDIEAVSLAGTHGSGNSNGTRLQSGTSGTYNLLTVSGGYITVRGLRLVGQAGWTGSCIEDNGGFVGLYTEISAWHDGTGYAFKMDGGYANWISNCDLETRGANTSSAVYIEGYATLSDSYLYAANAYCVEVEGSQPANPEGMTKQVIIKGCFNDGSDYGFVKGIGGNSRVSILDNTILFDGTDTNGAQIWFDDCHQLLIQGNNMGWNDGSGIKLVGCDEASVIGNVIRQTGHHGIWLLDCNDCLVTGNMVANASTVTDDTYSGIILDGDTNDCAVINNLVRRDLDSSAGNQPKYGIRVDDATCDTNFVTNNDLKNSAKSGGTGGAFSDAGTGTVTTAGNRTS